MDEGEKTDEAVVTVEIPAALADRIDRLYADCRGYEPSSLQEGLSVLCDLASGRLDPHAPETRVRRSPSPAAEVVTDPVATDRLGGDSTPPTQVTSEPSHSAPTDDAADFGGTAAGRRSVAPGADAATESGAVATDADSAYDGPHGTGDADDRIDEAFPARWSAAPAVRRQVRAVVDHFVRDPTESADDAEREAAALAAVAEREGCAPETLYDELVAALYGNAGLPDDLAGEFLHEALVSVVEADAPGTSFGDPASDTTARAGEDASEVGPLETDDAFDVDTLLGDVSQPMADCERCGETYPVNDLETVLGSKTATIELLCADCATAAE
ncbi:hypothetical protein [Haloarchaeobius sp. DT45]|uniref:hypothetical protein n=1 Tax=Haloarchaeobius sp. DT45 TaxID=3446116 RepID=UPI003F6D9040